MKVSIGSNKGWLRLRWQHLGKKYSLYLGMRDSPTGRAMARQKASQIEADIYSGNFDPTLLKYRPRILGKNATEISAPELFERFSQAMKREKALCQGSLERYRGCLSHVRRSLNIPAHQVTSNSAGKFASVLLESVSNRTAKEYLWLLKSCWDWARGKYHLAESNPWPEKLTKIKPQLRQRVKPFTAAEVRAILAGFKSDANAPNRYYSHYADVVSFLFGVGCRMGEAAGLRWRHISDTFETCWIGESISRGVRKTTKTGKARTILLSDSVRAMLRSRFLALNPKPDDLVFPAPKGGPICDRLFNRRAWHTVLERCNIEYRNPYSIRHTAISHALASGANPIDLAAQTGHDKRVLLDTYAHVINQQSLFVEF
jgi:integrase